MKDNILPSGWPGSTHDTHIFKNSHLFHEYIAYFSKCEYLLGDPTWKCFPFVVGVYKQAVGQGINHEEQIFNDALASPQVS